MTTRLAWNFEITNKNLLNFNDLTQIKDDLRWESRYFWPGDAIIPLNGLDERFLELSHYKAKHRQDSYILLNKTNFNIKERRMELLYKPLLQESEGLYGYDKKINLKDHPLDQVLPGTEGLTAADLLREIEDSHQHIEVAKEALIYKFPSEPTIKLELARLNIANQIYFSLCVEGHSQILVAAIAKQLLSEGLTCDYMSFLKQLAPPC